jgi:hypothetical protein
MPQNLPFAKQPAPAASNQAVALFARQLLHIPHTENHIWIPKVWLSWLILRGESEYADHRGQTDLCHAKTDLSQNSLRAPGAAAYIIDPAHGLSTTAIRGELLHLSVQSHLSS